MLLRLAPTAILAGCLLAIAGCAGTASPASPPQTFAEVAVQASDLPAGFHRCANFSGDYPKTAAAFSLASDDQKAWDTAWNAGALSAWIEVYVADANVCQSYLSATNPGSLYGVFQNMLFKYRDEASAHQAFVAGAFVPPLDPAQLSGKAPPLFGKATMGTGTELGTASFVNEGDRIGQYFWSAAWQSGAYISTIYSDHVLKEDATAAAMKISGRIPSAPAAPSMAAAANGSVAGAIAGDNLTDVFGNTPPALVVYAFRQDGPRGYYFVKTADAQRSYRIANLPAGVYHVIAYANGTNNLLVGAYTRMVACGYSPDQCKDHTLINVTVHPGETMKGINPNDYYVNPKTLPAEPGTA